MASTHDMPAWKRAGERAPRRGEAKRAFEPQRYGESLPAVLRALDAWHVAHPGLAIDAAAMRQLLRRHPREGRGFFSRSQLVRGLRALADDLALVTPLDVLLRSLTMRPTRSHSGVAPVTVFTRPHPCPGTCVFCPNDVRMPKSYLADEPGAQRAEDHGFDPYRQTLARLSVYRQLGHATDKVELLVLGGTWSSYPEAYRVWFVWRCFQALNDFTEHCEVSEPAPDPTFLRLPRRLDGRALESSYNAVVRSALRRRSGDEGERAGFDALELSQRHNERARARCVGLSVETRPDLVDGAELLHMRRLGVTKVQLGVQSLDDRVLSRNRRGHSVAQTRTAFRLLREAGFKIQAHLMPNLLGSHPRADRDDFDRLFADPDFRPDELKLYPCSLVPSAELMQHYERGEFRPYDDAELRGVVAHALRSTPRYCRLTRVIRDISSDDIVAGNTRTDLRERVARELWAQGERGQDIRAREVRGEGADAQRLTLRETAYATGVGEERFLEWVTADDRIAAFLRLSLPSRAGFVGELEGSALVRELHVYGRALSVASPAEPRTAQHQGLGRALLERAAELAQASGHARLSVISAVGTRGYYERLGFARGALYQHRALTAVDHGGSH